MEADASAVSPGELAARAATLDELLSDDFQSLPGLKRDTDRAAKRLAAWCDSSSSGDWELFDRRLRRDGHTIAGVLTRFGTPSGSRPRCRRFRPKHAEAKSLSSTSSQPWSRRPILDFGRWSRPRWRV